MAECTYTVDTYTTLSTHQLTIDVWNNVTANQCHIKQNSYILRIHVPPTPVDNKSIEYCYTK